MQTQIRSQPQRISDVDHAVQKVLDQVGKNVVVAIPLALGKPVHFVNALYRRIKEDPSYRLTILTALTLQKPGGNSLLEKRFLDPMVERVFGNCPDLEYELDRVQKKVPDHIRIIEFYFPAGKFRENPIAQQDYVSSNYTHVARDLQNRKVNVIAQMIRLSPDSKHVSLSCNPDVTLDMMATCRDILYVGECNDHLPYMGGDAEVPAERFDLIIDHPRYHTRLFAPPKMAVTEVDYMIGLYTSTLIKDNGELQIGIGALGDAVAYALQMRQERNTTFRRILDRLRVSKRYHQEIREFGGVLPFDDGLFGATEMLVDSFMPLVESGIVKRRVYDDLHIQRLLNEELIREDRITAETIYLLLRRGAIQPELREADFCYLQYFGVLRSDLEWENGHIVTADGARILADLNVEEHQEQFINKCLGTRLRNGAIIHAAFFLGPQMFYDWLRNMSEAFRSQIQMKSVTRINQLYGHEEMDRLHRRNARFVNTCMMMTLLGEGISDTLMDGTVISGVGGQYNFVAMAHALSDGRSILQLRSTRSEKGKIRSNVIWQGGRITIPRHLRDLVVTEYGVADLRGKTDREVIESLLLITDSRFQEELIREAKFSGKLPIDFELPPDARQNFTDRIKAELEVYKKEGLFPAFPFGTDLTDDEIQLGKALKILQRQSVSVLGKASLILKSIFKTIDSSKYQDLLTRMRLDNPETWKERFYRRLLLSALHQTNR